MKELKYSERIAIMRILFDIILADNKIDKREEILFDKVAKELNVENAREEVEHQNSLLALALIRDFATPIKEDFAKLMGQMIVIDKDINYKEVIIYNVVSEFCQIKTSFNITDYPNFTRS